MTKYGNKLLNNLLDKYENSKSFNKQNKTNQNFTLIVSKVFKKYLDENDYDTFNNINNDISIILNLNYITIISSKNDFIEKIQLNKDKINEIYLYLNRETKKDIHQNINDILLGYLPNNNIIENYINNQLENIKMNKNIEYTNDNNELIDIINGSIYLINNKSEQYIRDASINIYKDSKKLEKYKNKIQNLLYKYGDYDDKEHIFEECGIVKTPTYIYIKGNAILEFNNQIIDLNKLESDIGLSTNTILNLKHIISNASNIITIENLTAFYDFKLDNYLVIYLGGFHNSIKRLFLSLLYKNNKDKNYYHFGDIDAGGFYIFEHLCNKTNINFNLYNMDLNTLIKYQNMTKPLTNNDIIRLNKLLLNGNNIHLYKDVINYMLINNCKLEQESLK